MMANTEIGLGTPGTPKEGKYMKEDGRAVQQVSDTALDMEQVSYTAKYMKEDGNAE